MKAKDILTLISDVKLREVIHRVTNKVEQYNALEDWVRFAGEGTRALLAKEGLVPTFDELAALSPYQTRHIKRFGNYLISQLYVVKIAQGDFRR